MHEAADRLRAAGHEVHTPDLFDGRTAETVEEGMEIKDEIGQDELLKRAVTAAAPFSERGLVYAGFSLGRLDRAEPRAQRTEGARAAAAARHLGPRGERLASTSCRCSSMSPSPDPFEPDDWLNAWYLQMRRAGADVEIFRYAVPGTSTPTRACRTHDAEAAEATWRGAGLPREL